MAKKATKAVVMDDNELLAPLPMVTLPPAAQGGKFDFVAQKNFLEQRLAYVLSLELTAANIERVRTLKKGIVGWRTQFTKETDSYMKATFTAPKDVFKAARDEVLAEIASMEGKADEVLSKEEEDRVSGITAVLDIYKQTFQAKYQLSDERLSRIEYKKPYYNKGADEKDRKDDLEAQFIGQQKEQKAREANIRLITTMCKEDDRLNAQLYVDLLGSTDVASITEKIVAEKERLAALDNPADDEEPEDEDSTDEADDEAATGDPGTGTIVLGVTDGLSFETDFPGRNKSMCLELTYPCDLGDALTELFSRLRSYGVKTKPLPQPAAVF
jgi:hypothetical protein